VHSLNAAIKMELRFAVIVPAKYWVGTMLKTPQFAMRDLKVGLQAWWRLSEARGLVYRGRTNRYSILQRHSPEELDVAWRRLRGVYLDVWAEAGHSRGRVAKRITALEEKHQSCRQRLATRWSTSLRKGLRSKVAAPVAEGAFQMTSEMVLDEAVGRSDAQGPAITGAGLYSESRIETAIAPDAHATATTSHALDVRVAPTRSRSSLEASIAGVLSRWGGARTSASARRRSGVEAARASCVRSPAGLRRDE